MNSFISNMVKNNTFTTNGMPAHTSSQSPLVDMLFQMGSIRVGKINDTIRSRMITTFFHAFSENKQKAIKLLFHARDIDSGLGEREFFRVNVFWLIKNGYISIVEKNLLNSESIKRNIIRTDDIIFIVNELIVNKMSIAGVDEFIDKALHLLFELMKDDSISGIVAKWMPRKHGKYSAVVLYMRRHGYISTYSNYRKYIVSKTQVVEQLMSLKKWKDIDLSKVPSLAMKKYKKAFGRQGILKPFVDKLVAGETTVHAKRLYPHEIIHEIVKGNVRDATNKSLLNEQWKALKDIDDLPSVFRMLPIIDVSGSMTMYDAMPISIALGLGFFMSERNPNKAFRDYFITFSSSPTFHKITGATIVDKVNNALRAPWQGSTDLEKTFDLILHRAVEHNVPQNDMPTHLIIISDMQFNQCVFGRQNNATQMIKNKYARAGYEMPIVIFWNAADYGNLPAQITDDNVLLVSGKSQNTINFILKQLYENMEHFVDEVINIERYSYIVV